MNKVTIYGDNRHEKATKERTSCRAVVLSEGKLLLSYETSIDQYMLPGGGLEEGETLPECCIRELGEETGYLVETGEQYLTIEEYYEQWHLTHHYFLCKAVGKTYQNLTAHEKEVGMVPVWLPLEEAMAIFSAYARYADTNELKHGAYLREYTALKALTA